MKADPKVIEYLNKALKLELTTVNQYFLHARMLRSWGFAGLAKIEYEESIDEMKHADELIERILFLGATPKMEYLELNVGSSVRAQLEADQKLEEKAIAMYNTAITVSREAGDDVSRELFSVLLKDEELHVDWVETQLHQIGELGYEQYLSTQLEGPTA